MARELLFIYVVSFIRVFNSVKIPVYLLFKSTTIALIFFISWKKYETYYCYVGTICNITGEKHKLIILFLQWQPPPLSWNIQNRNHSLESLRQTKYETNIIIIFINYSRCKKSLCWTNIFIFPAYMRLFSRWNTASQKKEWGLCCKTCME